MFRYKGTLFLAHFKHLTIHKYSLLQYNMISPAYPIFVLLRDETHQIPMCHKYPLTGMLVHAQHQQPDIILNEFFNLSVRTKTIKNTISPIKNHKPTRKCGSTNTLTNSLNKKKKLLCASSRSTILQVHSVAYYVRLKCAFYICWNAKLIKNK